MFMSACPIAENYPRHLEAANIAFQKYGANFVVRGGAFRALEAAARERHVVIEFQSYQQALDCFHSPEYQAAAKLRRICSDSDIVIVEGIN
jgi:uncharacterized protein (DUF1330 family)